MEIPYNGCKPKLLRVIMANKLDKAQYFFRSLINFNKLECSWYDMNGICVDHQFVETKNSRASMQNDDDRNGYMADAKRRRLFIVDNAPKNHPKTIDVRMYT